MDFDWDDNKAETNFTKRGISFPDPDHSVDEERLIIIGHSHHGRLLFVSHTDRNNLMRIISAREVTRRERKVYQNVR